MNNTFDEIIAWVAAIIMCLIGLAFALLLGGAADWFDKDKNKKAS